MWCSYTWENKVYSFVESLEEWRGGGNKYSDNPDPRTAFMREH